MRVWKGWDVLGGKFNERNGKVGMYLKKVQKSMRKWRGWTVFERKFNEKKWKGWGVLEGKFSEEMKD